MRLFKELDLDKDGSLTYQEFSQGLAKLNVAPKTGRSRFFFVNDVWIFPRQASVAHTDENFSCTLFVCDSFTSVFTPMFFSAPRDCRCLERTDAEEYECSCRKSWAGA